MGWLGTRSMSGGCVFRGEIDVLIHAMFMAQASESVVILSFRIRLLWWFWMNYWGCKLIDYRRYGCGRSKLMHDCPNVEQNNASHKDVMTIMRDCTKEIDYRDLSCIVVHMCEMSTTIRCRLKSFMLTCIWFQPISLSTGDVWIWQTKWIRLM